MAEASNTTRKPDRKLGDEWQNWDGRNESTDTRKRVFLGVAALSIVLLILGAGLFLWLIEPRLESLGHPWPVTVTWIYRIISAALLLWLVILTWAVATNRPAPRAILLPGLINRLLGMVAKIGGIIGISTDRLTNSFLKVHNLLIGTSPKTVSAEYLLVLAPRCLTRENNATLRQLRDSYGFHMAVVGGGTEARQKIHEVRPRMIIAMACERDLLSGFKEVNPSIPVIGFPNKRPEGPCKNTCVDMSQIEQTVRRCLGLGPGSVS
ncbi:MAG TPA: DUF116 domain-containing protein [candidate division Zixibacteria bacterium]|nr:DUF116 domain-containing protein [candidate division Zixibacteria bacterium]